MSKASALLSALLLAAAAHAADDPLLRDYPTGSITTREQATAASQSARARAAEVEREYAREMQRCATVVLVTGCQNDARGRRAAQLRAVERVRREAREVTRRLDSDAHARDRAAEEARRAAEAPLKAEQAAKSRAAYEARQRAAQQRAPQASTPRTPKSPSPPRELSPEQRAENVKRLQEKQRAAAGYAQRKAKERDENARRREQRRLEREAEAKKRAAAAQSK
jgi:hypothetical protein